jgi:tetratricopeptide (TPR) repeat protein
LTDDRIARLAVAEDNLTAALSMAPESALAHLLLGVVQMHTNRASDGVASCERALDLDRNMAVAHAQIGDGKLLLGQPEETERHIQEALRLSPRDAHALARIGRLPEARSEARAGLALNPTFTIARFRSGVSSDDPVVVADSERVIDGLRKAGAPEE